MDQIVQGQGNIFSIDLEQFTASDNTVNIQVPVFSVRSRFRVEDFLKANEVTTIFTGNNHIVNLLKIYYIIFGCDSIPISPIVS